MKLKTTDLRKGNWINFMEDDTKFKVVGIDADDLGLTVESEKDGELWIECDQFNKIRLTPELLLSFGFTGNEDDFILPLPTGSGSELHIEFESNSTCLVRNHIVNRLISDTYDYVYIQHIYYVNQLQNLYWILTGEEMNIKL